MYPAQTNKSSFPKSWGPFEIHNAVKSVVSNSESEVVMQGEWVRHTGFYGKIQIRVVIDGFGKYRTAYPIARR